MKSSFIFLFVVFSVCAQEPDESSVRLLRSTITTVGSSSTSFNNYYIAQSIGQSGIIGKVDVDKTTVQQGFLSSIMSFEINNTSDELVNEILEFVVFPNPFIDYVEVSFSKKIQQDILIDITDDTGRLIKSKKYLPTNKIKIPIGDISVGLYFLQIKTGENVEIKKIIKTDH